MQIDIALLGELHSVVQKIDEDLPQSRGVADIDLRSVFDPVGKLQLLVHGGVSDHVERAFHTFAQIEPLLLQLHLARFDLREVQDVVEDGQERPRALVRRQRVIALFICQIGVEQDFRHADDRIHRRTDFMAHLGEEVGFVAAGVLQLQVENLQFLAHPIHVFGEVAKFVPVFNTYASFEVARRDPRKAAFDPPHRLDNSAGQEVSDQQRKQDRHHRRAAEGVLRQGVIALAFHPRLKNRGLCVVDKAVGLALDPAGDAGGGSGLRLTRAVAITGAQLFDDRQSGLDKLLIVLGNLCESVTVLRRQKLRAVEIVTDLPQPPERRIKIALAAGGDRVGDDELHFGRVPLKRLIGGDAPLQIHQALRPGVKAGEHAEAKPSEQKEHKGEAQKGCCQFGTDAGLRAGDQIGETRHQSPARFPSISEATSA